MCMCVCVCVYVLEYMHVAACDCLYEGKNVYIEAAFSLRYTVSFLVGGVTIQADLCIVMGSSLRVRPACEVPVIVQNNGGKVIVCK